MTKEASFARLFAYADKNIMKKNNKKKGQALVEYALIVGLIAVMLVAVLSGVGQDAVTILYKTIQYSVENAEQIATNASLEP